ncbi:hypothetical protein Aconfl_35730 [Algoriphagus confluentis]|uniref:Uncharacterized protein n=1 Tax=Algoriphagus confluentis TaxID=1697556 RepID=A0ABQ6PUG2_9BACT|nr:hypothetical protein Aconfl_35730 [Algoriphagus confluentis]
MGEVGKLEGGKVVKLESGKVVRLQSMGTGDGRQRDQETEE